jgi:hypothetical protein
MNGNELGQENLLAVPRFDNDQQHYFRAVDRFLSCIGAALAATIVYRH